MEKMVTLGIEIARAVEAPRKNYIVADGNERFYLNLTDEQKDFFDWLDNYGMLSSSCTIENVEKIEFERV